MKTMMPITSSATAKPRSLWTTILIASVGFFFVAVGEPVHRFDDAAALLGNGQGVDEIRREMHRCVKTRRAIGFPAAMSRQSDRCAGCSSRCRLRGARAARRGAGPFRHSVARCSAQDNAGKAIFCSAPPTAGKVISVCCSGRVQSLPRFTATMNAVIAPPIAMQESHIDRRGRVVPTRPKPRISICLTGPTADDAHDPDKRTNHEDRECQFEHRPGDCAEEDALRLNLAR